MAFAVTNNASFAAAVTAARNAYNEALPEDATAIATNDAYRDFVLDQAAQSCRTEFGVEPSDAWAQETWNRAQRSYFTQYV